MQTTLPEVFMINALVHANRIKWSGSPSRFLPELWECGIKTDTHHSPGTNEDRAMREQIWAIQEKLSDNLKIEYKTKLGNRKRWLVSYKNILRG